MMVPQASKFTTTATNPITPRPFLPYNNDSDNQPIKKILILVECPNKKETYLPLHHKKKEEEEPVLYTFFLSSIIFFAFIEGGRIEKWTMLPMILLGASKDMAFIFVPWYNTELIASACLLLRLWELSAINSSFRMIVYHRAEE